MASLASAVALLITLGPGPKFLSSGELEPQAALLLEAGRQWKELEARVRPLGLAVPASMEPIRLVRAHGLKPHEAARSRPGLVALRQARPWTLDAALLRALRHELAHQLLLAACPAASEDVLLHEAFALQVSGEASEWLEERTGAEHLSASAAVQTLAQSRAWESPRVVRALALLLALHPPSGSGFALPIERRLRACADRGSPARLEVAELAVLDSPRVAARAVVVLSRHSGEVLWQEGETQRPAPFASTLKPFIVAAAGKEPPPVLTPRLDVPEWQCGDGLGRKVDAALALERSCNGYFLDWGRARRSQDPFGAYGPLLARLGLSRAPRSFAEAAGLSGGLLLSPAGLAQAYRVLAELRPDVLQMLLGTPRTGTLAGAEGLDGIAVKTGTVRDAASTPVLGWLVAVDRDVVVVLAGPGVAPRALTAEAARWLERARRRKELRSAEVQVFARRSSPGDLLLFCPGVGVARGDEGPVLLGREPARLETVTERGPVLCAGGAWKVNVDGSERAYEGSFHRLPLSGPTPPPGALRVRRGSEVVFRTTEAAYAAGVVAAEDSSLKGKARETLLRVAAHNVRQAPHRHPGRPLCDTTHCQAFAGTRRPTALDLEALARPLEGTGWRPFSQGGSARWARTVPRERVEAVLARGVTSLHFDKGRVLFAESTDGLTEEIRSVSCDPVRLALKLPSCPSRATFTPTDVQFEGAGRGHGEGLDVEALKQAE
jgi:hypothetical protein